VEALATSPQPQIQTCTVPLKKYAVHVNLLKQYTKKSTTAGTLKMRNRQSFFSYIIFLYGLLAFNKFFASLIIKIIMEKKFLGLPKFNANNNNNKKISHRFNQNIYFFFLKKEKS
jgi:hypothetical protein